MWIWAASQSTNSPSIQILSLLVMGIGGLHPFCDGVANLRRREARVRSEALDRLGDAGGGVARSKEVQHQGGGDDGGGGIGLAGTGDVGGRPVDRLEHR